MAHSKLRKQNDCLNCGKAVEQAYCSYCGQQNREPYETVWGMFIHFVADIVHWDGKFWRTVKLLFLKPGILSKAYVTGKRASYVLPIRLYLICSLIFGLCLAYYVKGLEAKMSAVKNSSNRMDSLRKIADSIVFAQLPPAEQQTALKEKMEEAFEEKKLDSIRKLNLSFPLLDTNGELIDNNIGYSGDTNISLPTGLNSNNIDSVIKLRKKIMGAKYATSDAISDYIMKYFTLKKEKSHNGRLDINAAIIEEVQHTLPKSFFILMPLFALILWLMYSKKYFYFYHHMVFTIHYYCVSFVCYSLAMVLSKTFPILNGIGAFALLGMVVYLFIAIKKFYEQSYLKTTLKFSILTASTFFLLLITFLVIVTLGFLHA